MMSGDHDLDADADSAFSGNHLLEDLDSYLDDINSRLTITRMVGDSLTRGMINAISEESAEAISSKDAEINELNRRLQLLEGISTMQLREHDDGLMGHLSTASEKQIQMIKREIERMRCIHVDQGRSLESLTQIERGIDALREIINTSYRTHGLEDQLWRGEIEREIYASVMQETVRELREQRSLFDAQYDHWLKKIGEISDLQRELDSISKSVILVDLDLHHLLSHSSRESYEEANNIKKKDYIPGKEYEEINLSPLSHMSKEELTSYYKTEVNEIKRQLESSLHEKTEELFRVKRQFLKERALLLTTREKELEALKKGLPEICLRLDEILLEAKQIPSSRCDLDKRISGLLSENKALHDGIEEAGMEVFIKSQIDECIFSEVIHDATSQREDACMEIEIIGIIYSAILGGLVEHAQSLVNENKALREAILQRDKKVEQLKQEVGSLSTLVCKKDEALSLSVRNSEKIKKEFVSLSMVVDAKELTLLLAVKRSNELSQEVEKLQSLIEEKDEVILDVESKLGQQKSDVDRYFEECRKLKVQLEEQERLFRGYKLEIFDLTRKLESACKNAEEAEEERENLYVIIKEKGKKLSANSERMASMAIFVGEMSRSVEEFERIILRDLEERSLRLLGLSCECDKLSNWANLFYRSSSQQKQEFEIRSRDLRKEIGIIHFNLGRAENEVDRLGDEVDDLVDVLEKVYIAIDHYSPVLKHYVGVMEILEMIKRKLKEVNRQDP